MPVFYMLYLFDIDGTLIDAGGAGMAALVEANFEVFGSNGPPLDLAGTTDLSLVQYIHDHFETEVTEERTITFFEVYMNRLEWNLAHGGYPGRVLPAVSEILSDLSSRDGATLGLLTGNTARGAAAKMKHFGLDSHFPFGAYGCDRADRNLLGPIALERALAHTGRSFIPEETWVIGDTPKDIACAKAFGAKSLAVATGKFSVSELEMHSPDLVVETLDQAIGLI